MKQVTTATQHRANATNTTISLSIITGLFFPLLTLFFNRDFLVKEIHSAINRKRSSQSAGKSQNQAWSKKVHTEIFLWGKERTFFSPNSSWKRRHFTDTKKTRVLLIWSIYVFFYLWENHFWSFLQWERKGVLLFYYPNSTLFCVNNKNYINQNRCFLFPKMESSCSFCSSFFFLENICKKKGLSSIVFFRLLKFSLEMKYERFWFLIWPFQPENRDIK